MNFFTIYSVSSCLCALFFNCFGWILSFVSDFGTCLYWLSLCWLGFCWLFLCWLRTSSKGLIILIWLWARICWLIIKNWVRDWEWLLSFLFIGSCVSGFWNLKLSRGCRRCWRSFCLSRIRSCGRRSLKISRARSWGWRSIKLSRARSWSWRSLELSWAWGCIGCRSRSRSRGWWTSRWAFGCWFCFWFYCGCLFCRSTHCW